MTSRPRSVTLIPGDGIGPEVTAAATRVIDAAGADLSWEPVVAGSAALAEHGTPLPEPVLESIQKNGVALKGPLTTPIGKGFSSVNVAIRKRLDLYANFRPVKNLPGIPSRCADVNLIVVRENTEGLYSGLEHTITPDVTQSLKIITRKASLRIARFAFEQARKAKRRSVTAGHKANIMKLTDGLFLECCRKVSEDYPDIQYRELIVDNLAMQIVLQPSQFDVLLLTNLYGDIISDLCAGLVGGLGVVPGANIGDDCAVFEAVHGSAPDIAGKGIANPMAVLFSGILMLRHLGMDTPAERIWKAVCEVTREGSHLTPDLGGNTTTVELTDTIIERLERVDSRETGLTEVS